jgi:hypothetical protein
VDIGDVLYEAAGSENEKDRQGNFATGNVMNNMMKST